MIFEDDDKVRLTKSEMKLLRQRNAANGVTIAAHIETREQLLETIVGGLSIERAREMLEFIEELSDQDSGGGHA